MSTIKFSLLSVYFTHPQDYFCTVSFFLLGYRQLIEFIHLQTNYTLETISPVLMSSIRISIDLTTYFTPEPESFVLFLLVIGPVPIFSFCLDLYPFSDNIL